MSDRDGAYHVVLDPGTGAEKLTPNQDTLEDAKQVASDYVVKTSIRRAQVISNVTGEVLASFVKGPEED